MRHAKAESYADSDHARDLAPSGRRDAEAAGAWLAAHDIRPDFVLHSSAVRTTSTWQEVERSLAGNVRVESSAALYAAEPDTAIDLVRDTPADVEQLLVIGHNPTVGVLAQLLDDGEGDPEAVIGMITGFPTAAMAVFDVPVEWGELATGGLRLRAFHVPRAD